MEFFMNYMEIGEVLAKLYEAYNNYYELAVESETPSDEILNFNQWSEMNYNKFTSQLEWRRAKIAKGEFLAKISPPTN